MEFRLERSPGDMMLTSTNMSGNRTRPPKEIRVMGYRLHPMTGQEVIAQVAGAVREKRRLIMANLNLHAMATMYESKAMASLFMQPDTYVMIDGMPVLFAAKIFGHSLSRAKRATSLDFYDHMFHPGKTEGWRFAFVGADPVTLKKGMDLLQARHPGLDMEGRHGYFDIQDKSPGSPQREVIDWLKARSPDVLIVGMGMPRQEEWIAAIQHEVDVRVFMPTGAYLDYQVGTQRLAPRWIGQLGLEWLYRLLSSPRRLGYRYLIEPIRLAGRLLLRRHPQKAG